MAKKKLEVRMDVIYEEKKEQIKEIEIFENEVDEYYNLSREFLVNLFNQEDFRDYLRRKYKKELNIDEIVQNIVNSVAIQIVEQIKPIPKIPKINL
jgi:hypothetical protein